MDFRVRRLENDVSEIYDMLGGITITQRRHTSRFDEIGKQLDDLTTTQAVHGARLNELAAAMTAQGERLDQVEATQTEHSEMLREILSLLRDSPTT